jgi:hypothetical protein
LYGAAFRGNAFGAFVGRSWGIWGFFNYFFGRIDDWVLLNGLDMRVRRLALFLSFWASMGLNYKFNGSLEPALHKALIGFYLFDLRGK